MVRSWFTPLFVLASVVACSPSFDPASKLQSLRVLAVQKDKPYARPGETVHFSMLLDDASVKAMGADASTKRPLHIAWLPGFENPLGDEYIASFVPNKGCSNAKGGSDATVGPLPDPSAFAKIPPGTPIPSGFEKGVEFSYPLPSDIVTCHVPPREPKQAPFGVQFVFFLACAGDHIGFTGGDLKTFPFGCYTKDNVPLDSDAFVAGYSEVFAYEELRNANPVVKGFTVDGKKAQLRCAGAGCIGLEDTPLGASSDDQPGVLDGGPIALDGSDQFIPLIPPVDGRQGVLDGGPLALDASPGDAGGAGAGADAGAGSGAGLDLQGAPIDCSDPDESRCISVCTTEKQEDCPKHTIQLELDQADNQEHDQAIEAQEGGSILEQMWINYYSTAGKLNHDVKLLNDATTGWSPAHAADLLAPQVPGPFDVWGIAHDNRGGVNWVRIGMIAE